MTNTTRQFNDLLRDCQVQTAFYDVTKRRRRAPVEALLALLNSFGVNIQSPSEAGEVLQARRRARLARAMEPVQVAWNGAARPATVTLPSSLKDASLDYKLKMGDHCVEGRHRLDELPVVEDAEAESLGFLSRRLPLPKKLPPGYYDLEIHAGGSSFKSFIISSPRRAFRNNGSQIATTRPRPRTDTCDPFDNPLPPPFGCFLPLYALRTDDDWGVGSLTSLRELMQWAGEHGASDVGTLPLLAAFLDEPLEISPYRPFSRLFWNELYIDIEAIPELHDSPHGLKLVNSDEFRRRIEAQRQSELVDYREVMRLKLSILKPLAEEFFAKPSVRTAEFRSFLANNPLVEDYARFRAACERRRAPWTEWPESIRGGRLEESDYDPAAARYHQYVQWITATQLQRLQQDANSAGCGLYFDLPIGVDPGGYDVWRFPEHYALGASVGSPPDIVFTKGQDWGLPPLHPDRVREHGYELVRRVMENNCRFAGRLRIDHVLGFHRVYCIPPGFSAAEGAYINYHANELYAVAILESHRHQCELVGENLGTVPTQVNRRLATHHIAGMWVLPYELEPGRCSVLRPPSPNDVALLNTHDMPPLQAWWTGADIDDRLALGLVDTAGAQRERRERFEAIRRLKDWLRDRGAFTMEDDDPGELAPMLPLLRTIAASPARLLLLNLEDLWLETRPQNIPGTSNERPNWRRKAGYRFEEFRNMSQVLEALHELKSLHERKEQPA